VWRLHLATFQDYLETKRIAFPRFYFVAPAGAAERTPYQCRYPVLACCDEPCTQPLFLSDAETTSAPAISHPTYTSACVPPDLLDILSKGSNPQLILRHLPKNFDNVHNLSFRLDERGEPLKAATGMYSGEVRHRLFGLRRVG
jgi:hypothetical protein